MIKDIIIRASKIASTVFGKIEGGANFSLYIDKNGKAWAWGNNNVGQLGDNSVTNKSIPVSVLGAVKTFCQIAGGGSHTVAIDKNGRAWAWGFNSNGQLGDNSVISKRTPVSVLGAVKTFCKINAGHCFSLAIDKNGRAWAWGINSAGQLGDGSITSRLTPVSVAGAVKTFCEIKGGGFALSGLGYTVAIDKGGIVWAWGDNSTGQLGDNSVTSKRTPVSILGAVKTFCKIDAAHCHTVAIDKNGRAWGWGSNDFGQLGDNTTVSKRTPVSVLGAVKTFCEIDAGTFAGNRYTLAIDKNGIAWGWGNNVAGRLGDGTTTSRLTPVSVAGAVKTFCKIMAAAGNSMAIDKNGNVWAWGLNSTGELGDGTTTSRLTPVRVCNI